MKKITIYDYRRQEIVEGDTVAYGTPSELKAVPGQPALKIIPLPAVLHWSKVVSIISEGLGWCEIGPKITITLENGHVETGDGENGGWNLLKLPEAVA